MMDDTTLERGLRARPPADPVYRSRITATPPTTYPVTTHPRRRATGRPRPTSSANGLIAAIALVALGTGALFLAASLGPSPAVSPSPSPTWTPPSGLVTEEVAPGVLRVVRDSAGHDLESLGVDRHRHRRGRSGLDGRHQQPVPPWSARGGTGPWLPQLLGISPSRTMGRSGWGRGNANSYDGERWRSAPGNVDWWAVGPDGTVWGVRPDASFFGEDEQKPPGFVLSRIEDGRWVTVDLVGWPDDLIGDGSAPYGPGLVATADGSLWLIATAGDGGDDWRTVLMRYDGTTWDAVETPFDPWWIADGPDGSWVLVDRNVGTHDGETRIAWFVEGTWSESRVQLPDATEYWSEDTVRPVVASDGAVWLRVNLPDGAGGRQHVFPERVRRGRTRGRLDVDAPPCRDLHLGHGTGPARRGLGRDLGRRHAASTAGRRVPDPPGRVGLLAGGAHGVMRPVHRVDPSVWRPPCARSTARLSPAAGSGPCGCGHGGPRAWVRASEPDASSTSTAASLADRPPDGTLASAQISSGYGCHDQRG